MAELFQLLTATIVISSITAPRGYNHWTLCFLRNEATLSRYAFNNLRHVDITPRFGYWSGGHYRSPSRSRTAMIKMELESEFVCSTSVPMIRQHNFGQIQFWWAEVFRILASRSVASWSTLDLSGCKLAIILRNGQVAELHIILKPLTPPPLLRRLKSILPTHYHHHEWLSAFWLMSLVMTGL